jgi:hypothetical protein
MDFMGDTLTSGRTFRTLNIVDDASRECLAIEVDHGLSGLRVTRVSPSREARQARRADERVGEAWIASALRRARAATVRVLSVNSRQTRR